jgi:UDP-4-amino-4,6-dideoxy-N-acetyl-beta-L-altrosamine transaminase
MIPYAKQDIIKEDIDAVIEVLNSAWLTQGPVVKKFEDSIISFTGAKYATAVNSATSALHVACLAMNVGPGDLVWTSPNTFVASANCALYCGANIDFVDIDPQTYNMSIESLKKKLKNAEKNSKLPKVVIPVHFAGQPCDMPEIYNLSKKYNFKIIEDASHAIGASYNFIEDNLENPNNKLIQKIKIGSCKHSDITVFSFHPVKIITTGEGGMAMTNDQNLDARMKLFRSHGVTRDENFMTHPSDGAWYYQQIDLGYNYRMSDIQAAIGFQQTKRINNYISRRHSIAEYYDKSFQDVPINIPWQLPNTYSSYHLYVVTLDESINFEQRSRIFNLLRAKGIGVNLHYIPVHTHPYFESLGFKKGDFPVSENYYNRAISLPMYPTLLDVEQDLVIKSIKECFA